MKVAAAIGVCAVGDRGAGVGGAKEDVVDGGRGGSAVRGMWYGYGAAVVVVVRT